MTSSDAPLFPLPFTPFEEFLLAEDREDYPACPVVTAELSGPLDEATFAEAVRQAVARHPLFQALIQRQRFRRPTWIATSQAPTVSFYSLPDDPVAARTTSLELGQFDRIDLSIEPGLRVRVAVGSDRAVLFCQVHHCCADGPGIHRFLGDVLAIYGQMTTFDDPPELLPLDPSTLRDRDRWPADACAAFRSSGYWRGFLRSLFRYLMRVPAPLAPDPESTRIPTVRAHTCYLEQQDIRSLRRVMQQRRFTLHDLVSSELLKCLAEWNHQRGASERQLLRLVIPTDVRKGDRGPLPATNCVHVAFFGFRLREIRAAPDLAAACRSRMDELYQTQEVTHFDLGLALAAHIPGLINWLVRRTNRKGIAMLSSLGDPTRYYAARLPRRNGRPVAGAVSLERLAVRSLVRPGTYLNVSTSLLADRLAISATVDEGHCGPGSAEYFAAEMQRRLLALLND